MSADIDMAANQELPTTPAEAKDATGLMDLAVEIRNIIHGYILEEDKPIHLALHTIPFNAADRGQGGSELVRLLGGYYDRHRTRQFDPAIKKWVRKPMKHSSILYINRKIHQEAETVLYGKNSFIFDSTTTLGRFINKIGAHRTSYLRIIRVESWIKSTGRPALKALCNAKRLRKLEVKHSSFCREPIFGPPEPSLEQIARQMAPLFQSLLKSYEELGIRGSVWDVFSLYKDFRCAKDCEGKCRGYYHGNCKCICGAVDEHSKEIVKGIVRLAKERLKIKD